MYLTLLTLLDFALPSLAYLTLSLPYLTLLYFCSWDLRADFSFLRFRRVGDMEIYICVILGNHCINQRAAKLRTSPPRLFTFMFSCFCAFVFLGFFFRAARLALPAWVCIASCLACPWPCFALAWPCPGLAFCLVLPGPGLAWP